MGGYVWGVWDVCGCVWVGAGVRGYARGCAGRKVWAGVARCGRVCTGERKWVQVGTSVRECALVYAGVCESAWVSISVCVG